MTKYVKSELLEMENPYALLMEGDSLRESDEAIKELSSKEQAQLVTKMILGCPIEQLSRLNLKVCNSLVCTKFSETVGQASVLRKLLDTLNGEKPHLAFDSRDFNVSLFHKFPLLVASLIPDMIALEKKLVATAPTEQLSKISRKMAEMKSITCGINSTTQDSDFGKYAEEKRELTKLASISVGNSRDSLFTNNISPEEQLTSSKESGITPATPFTN